MTRLYHKSLWAFDGGTHDGRAAGRAGNAPRQPGRRSATHGRRFEFMRGWSSLVARRSHKPKVAGSNPAPATNSIPGAAIARHLRQPFPNKVPPKGALALLPRERAHLFKPCRLSAFTALRCVGIPSAGTTGIAPRVRNFLACSHKLAGQAARDSAELHPVVVRRLRHGSHDGDAGVPNPRNLFTFAGKEDERRC